MIKSCKQWLYLSGQGLAGQPERPPRLGWIVPYEKPANVQAKTWGSHLLAFPRPRVGITSLAWSL